MPGFYLKYALLALSAVVIVALLFVPFPSAHPIQAATDYYNIKITSPADGATVTESNWAITISWSTTIDRFNSRVTAQRVQVRSSGDYDYLMNPVPFTDERTLTGRSGSATYSYNNTSGIAGTYLISADVRLSDGIYAKDHVLINYQPGSASGSAAGPIIGILVGVGAIAVLTTLVQRRKKNQVKKTPVKKTAPPAGGSRDLYQDWWNKATPEERKNWDSFEKFLSTRLGPANLNGYVDEWGRPSWASAYTAWQNAVKSGNTKASFEDWTKMQRAGEQQSRDMMERGREMNRGQSKDIADAGKQYSDALRNKERFEKLVQMSHAVSGDSKLSDFVEGSWKSIINDKGEVDPAKLAKLEGTLRNWISRDKVNQSSEYTTADAWKDTFHDLGGVSNNFLVRVGAGFASGGASEFVFLPVSAVCTMGNSLAAGSSTLGAVVNGFADAGLQMASGELINRGINAAAPYAQSYLAGRTQLANLGKLSGINSELGHEVSTISQLAKQGEGQIGRDAFMKSSEVAKLGENSSYQLTSTEKSALQLNNNPEFRKALSENHNLLPDDFKEVMGTAKQKAYQNAQNMAISDVMNQKIIDGKAVGEDPLFIQQTGTHARPGNPAWNPVKSDFDHTIDFGSSEYNQLYEQKFNAHLEGQGTSASAIDANVYGDGTSSRGAYSGGSMKFVQNYNQTTGSDLMIRTNPNGQTIVSRETPQTINSLLGKMQPDDVASARSNYQTFFDKSLAKGGDLNNMITNSSKEVSRTAGQYSVNYADHFHNTGTVSYKPPEAAKVADLIKKQGYSVDNAIQKVGYSGSKSDLLNDYKKIMGR